MKLSKKHQLYYKEKGTAFNLYKKSSSLYLLIMDEFLNFGANEKLEKLNRLSLWKKFKLFLGFKVKKELRPLTFEVPKPLIKEFKKLTKNDQITVFYDGTFFPIVNLILK